MKNKKKIQKTRKKKGEKSKSLNNHLDNAPKKNDKKLKKVKISI